jgi:hypothetical protein
MRFTKMHGLSAALVAVVAGFAAFGSETASAASGRAFRGSCEGVVDPTSVLPNLKIDYTGQATHMSHFTRHEEASLAAFPAVSGHIWFTAPDGDVIEADFDGAFTILGPVNVAEGTYTFTGGTGKYTGATGSATFRAETPDFIHASVTFEGRIDY